MLLDYCLDTSFCVVWPYLIIHVLQIPVSWVTITMTLALTRMSSFEVSDRKPREAWLKDSLWVQMSQMLSWWLWSLPTLSLHREWNYKEEKRIKKRVQEDYVHVFRWRRQASCQRQNCSHFQGRDCFLDCDSGKWSGKWSGKPESLFKVWGSSKLALLLRCSFLQILTFDSDCLSWQRTLFFAHNDLSLLFCRQFSSSLHVEA